MIARRRATADRGIDERRIKPAPRLSEAGTHHDGIESPALMLQARLGAELVASSPFSGEPAITPWPGAMRVAILLGGIAGSWMLVWQLTRIIL